MRRLVFALLIASAFVLMVATTASAEGGTSVATAPSVVAGQQEFGNMRIGSNAETCEFDFRSWWLLPVIAGDTIQIAWEAQKASTALRLYPPGTTDYNFPQAQTLVEGSLNSNLKAELIYQATNAGSVPVLFSWPYSSCTGGGGPYSFTAYITHGISASLPRITVLHSKGVLAVSARTPEGGTINDPSLRVEAQIKGRGQWQTIGVATVLNSIAAVHFRITSRLRHAHVTLRAIARGVGYNTTATSHLKVRTL